MIIIHAVSQVQVGKEQAYLDDIQELVAASRAEDGNVSYDLYRDPLQDQTFIMVEVWKDAEAVAAHNASEHFTSFVARAKDYLAAPLDVKVFNGEAVKRK